MLGKGEELLPQPVRSIGVALPDPVVLAELPTVDDARPRRCPACQQVQPLDGPLLLWGHGVRWRLVVFPPAPGVSRPRLLKAWERRFLCTSCGHTCGVRPAGVVARFLYTVYAIVTAWRLAIPAPVGEGLDDAAVYARQGVDRLTPERVARSGRSRWHALERWAQHLETWWPGRAALGTTWRARVAALLTGFTVEGDVLHRALASHASRGAAM